MLVDFWIHMSHAQAKEPTVPELSSIGASDLAGTGIICQCGSHVYTGC